MVVFEAAMRSRTRTSGADLDAARKEADDSHMALFKAEKEKTFRCGVESRKTS